MKLGQIHYHTKQNEIITFPVAELDYDYILILDIIRKYQKQINNINFKDYINNMVSKLANELARLTNSQKDNSIQIKFYKTEIQRIQNYFPNYFSISL